MRMFCSERINEAETTHHRTTSAETADQITEQSPWDNPIQIQIQIQIQIMPRFQCPWTLSWQARSSVSFVLATVSLTLCGPPRASSAEAEEEKAPQPASSVIHHHLSHTGVAPIPPIRIFRPNPYLEIAYDVRTRLPVYVLEQLQPEQWGVSKGQGSTRRPHFTEEKELPESYRSRNSHYRNTEYDRGHMAPAADFSHDRKQLTDTFTLSNTAPQVASVNRKVWAALEDWTRLVARAAHEQSQAVSAHESTTCQRQATTTLVLTGPLFLPARKMVDKVFQYEYAAIGQPPALQSVPTHFFKVVVVVSNSKGNHTNSTTPQTQTIQAFACFVVPNHESVADETDLTQFVVPWTALEAVSGLEMFSAWTTTNTMSLSKTNTNTNANANAGVADWKASADAVTRAITQHQNQTTLLLLTDGKQATSSGWSAGGGGKKRNQKLQSTPLQHLCSKGQCQRPYKLHSSLRTD